MRLKDILRRDQQASGKLEHLEKRGLVKIGKGGLSEGFWTMDRPLDSGFVGLAALLEERDSGR